MRYAIVTTLAIVEILALLGRLGRDVDDGRTTIEFWTYGTGGADNPAGPFWDEVAKRFTAQHPRVRVKVVADIAHGPYLSVLTTRFIGGNPPDVMIMDDGYIGQLENEGLLMPLEAFIQDDPEYRAGDFPPSMVRDGYVGDTRFGIPWYGGFGCVFYRRDLFAEAGVEAPRTWDELVEVCRALQNRPGLEYPLAFTPKEAFWMMPWVWQNGSSVISPDCRTIAIDSPAFIEAVQFVHDLMHRHKVADPGLARGGKVTDAWSNGTAALIIAGSWDIARFDDLYPQWKGKWEAAPLPAGRRAVSFFGGQHLVMSKQSKVPDLAWAFMSFACSPENQRLWADYGVSPPGNLRVYAMPEFQRRHPHLKIVPEVMPYGRNNSFAPFYKKIWYELFQSKVLDVAMPDPNADIAAAVREAAREMQAVADDYWATHEYYVQGKQS